MTGKSITIDTYHSRDITVVAGVLQGDPLSFADELVLDDVYTLRAKAPVAPLDLIAGENGLWLARDHTVAVHLDCCLTLMGPEGNSQDLLVLVLEQDGLVLDIHAMALGDLRPGRPYRLVGIARETATRRFAEAAAGSFAHGTRITMADGSLRAVETLQPGDLVLTRDAGMQPLVQVAQSTLRAEGRFAPVVIRAGALHNDADLVLRPDHRLFIYQRRDLIRAGRAELLVRAAQLVDGERIFRRPGGFVDYVQLVFADHQIIYAEGIAAESYLVDETTMAALPAAAPRHSSPAHLEYQVEDHLIDPLAAADLLRRASTA
jgi:hypothetical protein